MNPHQHSRQTHVLGLDFDDGRCYRTAFSAQASHSTPCYAPFAEPSETTGSSIARQSRLCESVQPRMFGSLGDIFRGEELGLPKLARCSIQHVSPTSEDDNGCRLRSKGTFFTSVWHESVQMTGDETHPIRRARRSRSMGSGIGEERSRRLFSAPEPRGRAFCQTPDA
jgi:hypothetical protein